MSSELVSCLVCGSRSLSLWKKDNLGNQIPLVDHHFSKAHRLTYQINLCNDCTHRFCSSPSINISELYGELVDEQYLAAEKQRAYTALKVLNTLKKVVPRGSRLLDIGCATGTFLREAQQDYIVEGLEVSKWYATEARKRGLKIHNTTPSNFCSSGQKYECISMWGVIEHFTNPAREVESIRRILTDEGIVALWTGNCGGIVARILGKHYWYIQGQHMQFFTKKSIVTLFEKSGFELVSSRVYPFVTTPRVLANSLGRYPALALVRWILRSSLLEKCKIHLNIPGEMFLIFRKVSHGPKV